MKNYLTTNRLPECRESSKMMLVFRNIALVLIFFSSFLTFSFSQINGCTGTVLDSGGAGGNYSNNESITETYCSDAGNEIKLTFTSFNVEENFDYLFIYDGLDDMAPLIGVYTNSTSPGAVVSTNGCLTLVFESDASTNLSGYSADITCLAACDVAITSVGFTNATCGNNDGTITVVANGAQGTLEYSIDGGLSFQASGVFAALAPQDYQILVQYNDGTCPTYDSPLSIATGCFEICDNGIDDDGDGDIDGADSDCDNTEYVCNGMFYDDGGPNGNYTVDTMYVNTLCADNGGQIQVNFTSFELDLGVLADTLLVFDGPDTFSNIIGKYYGRSATGTEINRAKSLYRSTEGCLTFQLKSGPFSIRSGWEARVSCTPAVGGFGVEICGNAIDDDFDGLVDFQDPDCPESLDVSVCQQGFEYYVPPIWKMAGDPSSLSSPAILSMSTSFPNAEVTISTQDGSFFETRSLTAGAPDTLLFGDTQDILRTDISNMVENNKGLLVQSDFPIQLLYVLNGSNNKTLMTIKGKEAQGKSFRVGSQTNTLVQRTTGFDLEEHHFISALATEDNTTVTFEFSIPMEGITSPHSVVLNAGESYLIHNDSFNITVSGSLVTSDKEIVVASGSQHTGAYGVTESDGGVDMLVPARSTGTEYILVRGGVYDIQDYGIAVAIENNTVITVDGVDLATINAGDYFEIPVTGVFGRGTFVQTSKSTYVYQVSGLLAGEVGMAIVAPIGACRGDNFASFSRLNNTDEFALNIIIANTGLATLTLNGALFSTYGTHTVQGVPSLPGYSTVTIADADIAAVNVVESAEFFNASILIGVDDHAGTFGFITSFNEKINIIDPNQGESVEFYVIDTICRNDVIDHTLLTLSCGNTDKIRNIEQGALGTATVTGDLSFQYVNNGTVGADVISVTVINEFGIQSTVCIGIRIDSLLVEFNPNDTTICIGDVLIITPDTIGSTGPYDFLWSTGEITPTISVSPIVTTIYSVMISDPAGCSGVDTFLVNVLPNIIADAGEDVIICTGEFAQLAAIQPVGTTGSWSGGVGVFNNTALSNAVYTPDVSETDSVTLFWNLDGTSGSQCFSGTDSMKVFVTPSLTVDAGDDLYVCSGIEFDLANLNAQINSSSITDGIWTSSGDGLFMAGSTIQGDFATSTAYVPGDTDIVNGYFILTLSANDTNSTGPCSVGSDDVIVTLRETPILACNDGLNISLNSNCSVTLNADMLIENPIEPIDYYIITLKDEFGNVIPGVTLNSAWVGHTIEYSVGYECGGNSCWGYFTLEDKVIPDLEPNSVIVDCRDEVSPEDVGFPLPDNVVIFPEQNDSYSVMGFDGCGNVTLTYEDDINDFICAGDYATIIYRNWTATDESGNTTTGIDTIYVERITLAEVVLPLHYDDIQRPVLSCDVDYPSTDEGYPSPEYTGAPWAGACTMIQSTYTDVKFEMCGNTYKVLREWLILDWCTSESITHFQTIKVMDKVAPSLNCPANTTISTDSYSCNSGLYLLPEPGSIDNCSNVTISASAVGPDGEFLEVVVKADGSRIMADLPLGTSVITFTSVDECENGNTCTYTVTTIDDVPPTPVCDTHTKVSLNNVGTARLYASSIDDGSHDNCEIATIKIAKMPLTSGSDDCGFYSGTFGDYVDFCCLEMGQVIMVALEITDIYGNSNVCMTEVELEDKIFPLIQAPTDLTISCTTSFDEDDLSEFGIIASSQLDQNNIIIYDEENNGVVGKDGIAFDNCGYTLNEVIDIDVDCGVGEIRRTFTVVDVNNSDTQHASDVQVITIVNSSPFIEDDIHWPAASLVSGCNNLDTDPSVTGVPDYENEDCASIVSSYEDKYFTISDSACVLVLREWKVLDMCQYNANTGEGIWSHIQSIKLNNTVAPSFTATCVDTTVCTYGACEGNVKLNVSATDDCTDALLLVYSYTIDADDNGVVDYSGNSSYIDRTLVDGIYRVRWTVEDLCGNIEYCDYLLTVEDCKNPTPYCLGGIATALMNNVGEVMISAESFDLGSFDNCTDMSDLRFSFSSDVYDIERLVTCDSMTENGVVQIFDWTLWVTDAAGNQDYCAIQLKVQDNFEACDNVGAGSIVGEITSSFDEVITKVDVTISSDYDLGNETILDVEGDYAFYELPLGFAYNVSLTKTDNVLNGITTLDIVLIQKHILGIDVFDEPYKYIAGDVNKSNSISGVDIIQLRKAILGYYDEFPNNDSWRFVDGEFTFNGNSNFDFPEFISINSLVQETTQADFVGIKIGDINGSAKTDEFLEDVSTRTVEKVEFELIVDEESHRIHMVANEEVSLVGMQWELSWNEGELLDVESTNLVLANGHTRMMDNGVKMAFNSDEAQLISKGQKVLTFLFDENEDMASIMNSLALVSTKVKPELYDEFLNVYEVEMTIRNRSLVENKGFVLYQNQPNPFQQSTSISFELPQNDRVEIQVIGANGQIVFSSWTMAHKGLNVFSLSKEDLPVAGVYYYKLNSKFGVATKKMILMN